MFRKTTAGGGRPSRTSADAPAAAVGGAGTAAPASAGAVLTRSTSSELEAQMARLSADFSAGKLQIPSPSSEPPPGPEGASLVLLEWLAGAQLAGPLDDVSIVEPAAKALGLTARLSHMRTVGMAADASDSRLQALRHAGAAADATTVEREYAALYSKTRDAQRMLVDALAGAGDFTAVQAADLAGSARVALPVASTLLAMPVEALTEGLAAAAAAVAAAQADRDALAAAFDDAGFTPARMATRLRWLQMACDEEVAVASSLSVAERSFREAFAPVRAFRQQLREVLAAARAAVAPAAATEATDAGDSARVVAAIDRFRATLADDAVADLRRTLSSVVGAASNAVHTATLVRAALAAVTSHSDAAMVARACDLLAKATARGGGSSVLDADVAHNRVAAAMRRHAASSSVAKAGCDFFASCAIAALSAERSLSQPHCP